MGRLKQLQTCSLLQSLSSIELAWLAAIAEPLKLKKGGHLIETGLTSHGMILIVEGEVRLFHPDHPQDNLGQLPAGEIIGEIALLNETVHLISAEVTSAELHALLIPSAAWQQLLQAQPAIAGKLLRCLAQQLQDKVNALQI